MFRGWLRDAEAGKLADANPSGPQGVRNRSSQFGKIEERLVKYILLRREKFVTDKLGLSWVILREKALDFAKQELGDDADSFTASSGLCLNVLRVFDGMALPASIFMEKEWRWTRTLPLLPCLRFGKA
eukprot:scpid67343/ scgid29947/ 